MFLVSLRFDQSNQTIELLIEFLWIVVRINERPMNIFIELTLGIGVIYARSENPAAFSSSFDRSFDSNEQNARRKICLKKLQIRQTSSIANDPNRIFQTRLTMSFNRPSTKYKRIVTPLIFAPSRRKKRIER